MSMTNHYQKIIAWSEEDQCYVGTCPSLMYGGCHGDNEKEVFDLLCKLVEETIEHYQSENIELPKPLSLENFYGKAA
jgi:predicted RNase H-like HicB family nuclease